MTFANGRPTLAIPGPSPVPDRVLRAMHRASPDIYAGEAVALNEKMVAGLKRLAGTRAHLAPYIGNGHAGWEAANANLFSRGDKALVIVTGLFGMGWAQAAQAMGVEVETLDSLNAPFDVQRLADRLAQDRDGKIRAVLVTQIDTASSVRCAIPAIRAAMGDHPALLAVDCIASLGCEPFFMDDWGVDVMVAASQKGLMVPPGMAFVWFSDRAAAQKGDLATPYWDWTPRAAANELWQYWGGTPPVQHIYGMAEALAMIEEETLPAVWARHEGLARATWAAFEVWGQGGDIALRVSDEAARARSVTAARITRAQELRDWTAAKAGVTLGVGLGATEPQNALRVAHMGHVSAHMTLGVLAVMEAGMAALSIPRGKGAIEAAAAEIARLS